MKRVLSLILAVILVATMSIGAEMLVSAEGAMQIIVSSAKAVQGGKADVSLSVKNNPGVGSMTIVVAYPSELTLEKVAFDAERSRTANVEGGAVDTALEKIDNENGKATLSWLNSTVSNVAGNFTLATLTFAVAKNATVGDKKISATPVKAKGFVVDMDENDIDFATVDGKISVSCAHANKETKGKKAATCTEAGYTGDTYCKNCGVKISSGTVVKALGHKSSDWKVVKAAARGVAGSKQKVCTVCKAVLETATIDALPYPTYTITYKLDGGKNASGNPKTYKHNAADITLKNPTKKGYKFEGWYIGSKKVTKIAKGTNKNITLTAKWSKVTYKITYKLAGGKAVKNPATYTITTSTIKLKNPTKKGYKFKGWYNGSKKVTEIKKGSAGNLTLTAKWTVITYKITYKLDSGKNNAKNPKSYKVTTATIKLKDPTRKGYTFKGWYNGSKKVTTISKGSTGSITLTAKWKKK